MDRLSFREAYDPLRTLRSTWEFFKRSPVKLSAFALVVVLVDPAWFMPLDFALIPGWIQLVVRSGLWIAHVLLQVAFARVVASVHERGRFSVSSSLLDLRRAGLLLVVDLPVSLFTTAGIWFAAWLAMSVGDWIPWNSSANWLRQPTLVFLAGLAITAWIGLGISLAPKAVVFEGLGPFAAVRRSWTLVRGNRFALSLYFGGLALVVVLGLLALVVGVIPAGLAITIAQNESYLRLVGAPSVTPSTSRPAPLSAPAT